MLERIMADNGFPSPLAESRGCRVFQFQSETGEGVMTQYDLFPGVYLMYNDFHMEGYDSAFHATEDMLCIDYCRQGRMEYPAGPDAYSYVEAGDLKLDRRLEHQGHFTFPLSHYHGITIGFTLSPCRPIPKGVGTGVPGGSGAAPGEVLLWLPPQGDSRGALGGSHLPGTLRRAGANQTTLLPHQGAGVAAVPGCSGTGR